MDSAHSYYKKTHVIFPNLPTNFRRRTFIRNVEFLLIFSGIPTYSTGTEGSKMTYHDNLKQMFNLNSGVAIHGNWSSYDNKTQSN
jgi:hypothetical protein